jgi:indole-3-glycerol phosphate synthase
LSDSQYFGGSIEDVRKVSTSVKIPVIRKDFIIDELQIDEARAFGASAILLIVRILSPQELKRLHSYSKSLGMDVLVETHNRQEIDLAVDAGAEIIGINTRDLDNFQIYSNLVKELADSIPKGIVRIGESGIHSRSDWENLKGIVDGLLIGTYFMKSPNIEKAYTDLLK